MSKQGGIYLGPEDAPYDYEGGQLLHNLLLFGRVCRILGMDVTPNRMMEVARALEFVSLGRKQDVYFTMRGLIVKRRQDMPLFDEAFELFWKRPTEAWTQLNLLSLGEERRKKKTQFLPPPGSEPSENQDEAQMEADPALIAIVPTYSVSEALRHKDFADMTGQEIEQIRRAIAALPRSLGFRRARRLGTRRGAHIVMRKALRENMRYAGEPLFLPTRSRKIKPRPVVLICDISGSMERYTRVLLHLIYSIANTMYQVEAFLYSTQLTRITHPIRRYSVDETLRHVGADVKDWGGGTKTGDALKTFNKKWGRRVLGRGAIVMLITDGWDRGDPDELGKAMKRLQMSCHRLIWLNPLLGAVEYEPLTRGAQAMLPHVDEFLPIDNLASLEMLIEKLQTLTNKRSGKPEHTRLIQSDENDAAPRSMQDAGPFWATRRSKLSDKFRRDFYHIADDTDTK